VTAAPLPVCRLSEIPSPGSKGVSARIGGQPAELFLVRRDREVYAYRNSCPHTGAPLDWQPDQFLDLSGAFIQCAMHGALFRIEDGECLQGPCPGQRLSAVPAEVRGEVVYLLGCEAPA